MDEDWVGLNLIQIKITLNQPMLNEFTLAFSLPAFCESSLLSSLVADAQ
jgi:hypothetical protein